MAWNVRRHSDGQTHIHFILTSRDNLRDAQQPVTVTVQIEHAPRKETSEEEEKVIERGQQWFSVKSL